MISIKTTKKLIAILISVLLCFCMCACGGNDAVEETVEITTPAGGAAQDAGSDEDSDDDEDSDEDEDSDDDEDSDEDETSDSEDTDNDAVQWSPQGAEKDKEKSDKPDKDAKSPYKKIYKACDKEMKEATAKYVEELNDKAGSISKSELYDETQDRIDALKKIYDKNKETMVDTMLKSTEDDDEAYEKYFAKMTEKFTEYTREITAAYTNQF